MKLTNFYYLFFHFLVLGSVLISKIFYRKMTLPSISLLIKILPASLLFIIWDSLVSDKWWFFNEYYILPIPKFFNLPIEEILFFFTVPLGLLAFLENLHLLPIKNISNKLINQPKNVAIFLYLILFSIGIISFNQRWWYSLTIVAGLLMFLNDFLLLNKKFFLGLLFTVLMTLIFNYYLTVLPIVTYSSFYKSNFLVLTIPIEDFFYGVLFYLLIIKNVYKKTN